MRGKPGVISCVVVVCLAPGAMARAEQDPSEVAIPDFAVAIAPDEGTTSSEGTATLELGDVIKNAVYAVSKRPQLVRETPGVASVITHEQARSYGWDSLNDVLYRQPGFAPSRDYERRVVAARGQFESWNNNHLLMLIDGVPFNDNLYGSAYTWEITPLDLAKAVEVVRGPASALYGGNATSGVINIRTPTIEPGERQLRGRANLGVDGTQRYRAYGAQASKDGSVIISYDRFTTPGEEYASYDASGRTDGGTLQQFNVQDHRTSQYVFAKVSGNQIAKGLSAQLHYQDWDFQTGHGWLFDIPEAGNKDQMSEWRALAALSYRRSSKDVEQEYVVRFQRHHIDWHNRYYPAMPGCDPADSFCYIDGLSEQLKTHTDDVFARAQAGVDLPEQMHFLAGAEYTGFRYTGDEEHLSNVNLTTFERNPGNMVLPQGPYLEWIKDHMVHNVGAFAQVASGQLLGRRATATLGARFDRNFFTYTDISAMDRPNTDKHFQQLSPRAALVLFPTDRLSVKLLAGQGFRAPAPSELFGANTFALASNIAQLKPETVTTYELAFDWAVTGNWIWRANVYRREFNNQIAYSVANANLSTNVYSNTTAGAETELIGDVAINDSTRVQGFANYSLVHLLDEHINDPTIATSSKLTWAPQNVANLGVDYRMSKLDASAQLHLQGAVRRRDSDVASAANAALRPGEVDAWASVDARVAYRVMTWMLLGVQATNLLDDRATLIKNNDYPFDYRSDGRRVLFTLDLEQ